MRFQPRLKGNSGYDVTQYGKHKAPDAVSFPKRSYKSLVTTTNKFKGISSTLKISDGTDDDEATHHSLSIKSAGPTWRETTFNDGKYLNAWNMDYAALRPVLSRVKIMGLELKLQKNLRKDNVLKIML